MDSTGWAVVIAAACLGVGGIITNVVTLVIGYFDRLRLDAREETKLRRIEETAEAVELVRLTALQAVKKTEEVAKKVETVKTDLINANGTLKVEIVQAVAEVVHPANGHRV